MPCRSHYPSTAAIGDDLLYGMKEKHPKHPHLDGSKQIDFGAETAQLKNFDAQEPAEMSIHALPV